MDFSPASTVTAMNGNDCHTTSSVATVYAGTAPFVAQLNCAQCWPPPSQCGSRASAQLTIPPSGLKNQTKITDADTAGMAQASSAAPLTNAAIRRPSRCNSSPTRVPVIMVSVTTTAAKITVVRSDSQNSGSDSAV